MVVLLLYPFRINVNLFCQIHFLFCLTFCRLVATMPPISYNYYSLFNSYFYGKFYFF